MTSVRDYGAKGDGASDDTAAFAACLAENAVADVPQGVFKLTALDVPAGRAIRGLGAGLSTLLTASGMPAGSRMLRVRNVRDVRIESLDIDGNGNAQPASEQAKSIYVENARDVRLYDLRIHDSMGDCVSVYGTEAAAAGGGVLIDRFEAWNQGRAAIVVHGTAPTEVAIRDATVSRGTPVLNSPSVVGLIDIEPSNPGIARGISIERVNVIDGALTVAITSDAVIPSRLQGLTMRSVKVQARAGNVGVSLSRVYGAVIDDVEVVGEASVPFTVRDSGPGIVGEMGRIVVTRVRCHGVWTTDGITCWTNGKPPPGGVLFADCEVSGVAKNPNAGRSFFVGDGLADVSLFGCKVEGGAQGFGLTGVSRALLVGCESRGASLRAYRFRGGAPYRPMTVNAYECHGDAPLMDVSGDVAGNWQGITT